MENNYRLKGLEGPRSSPLQLSLVYEYMSKGWGGAKPNPAHKATKKYRKGFQQDGMTNGKGFWCPILDNPLEPYQDEKTREYLEGGRPFS